MIKKLIKLVLIVSWMGLIFSFSNDTGVVSTRKSDGIIIRVVEFFKGEKLSPIEKDKWTTYLVVPVRKGAHLGVYFILGVLIISFYKEFNLARYKMILLALLTAFLYACSDELHQLFIPGRSGQIKDIILDTVGASLGILFYSFIVRWFLKYEQKERSS